MWRQLILFLAFCFFSFSWKACGAYEWEPGTVGAYNIGDWQKMAGMYSTALPGFDGWLWAGYCRDSIATDSKGFVKGKFEVGGLMYCVAYAVRVSSSNEEKKQAFLFFLLVVSSDPQTPKRGGGRPRRRNFAS